MIIGETWLYKEEFLRGDEWDTIMNYVYYDAIKDLFLDKGKNKGKPSAFIDKMGFMLGNAHPEVFPILLNLFDTHDTKRFFHELDYDKKRFKAAVLLELLMPGIPFIYYGDEVGLHDKGDDSRVDMKWEEGRDLEILSFYKEVLHLRKEHPEFLIKEISQLGGDDERNLIYISSLDDKRLEIDLNEGTYRIIQG